MPTVKMDRILRSTPDGDGLMVAPAGEQVLILESQGAFTRVRLVNLPGTPIGWLSSDSIDTTPTPTGPLDKRAFMRTCIRQADLFEVQPHYLVAVAELRSRIRTDQQDGVGPFGFIQAEWDATRENADYGISFDSAQIGDWTAQCIAFALFTHLTEEKLIGLLGRRETATELYLAQLIGSKAAAVLIVNQDLIISDELSAVAVSELPPGGLTPKDILRRYSAVLGPTDQGKAANGSLVMGRISEALKKALNDTSPLIPHDGISPIKPEGVMASNDSRPAPIDDTDLSLPQRALNFFIGTGWTRAQALGLIANIAAESSFDTKAVGDRNLSFPAFGLFQWRDGRVTEFARLNGHELKDATFIEQLAYANHELRRGTETPAGDALAQQKSPADAAKVVCSLYERPKDPDGVKAALRAKKAIEFEHKLV